MTASILEALKLLEPEYAATQGPSAGDSNRPDAETSLTQPELGKPIKHSQIIDIWKQLKAAGHSNYTLEGLLRGSRVYVPPPPPRPEPSDEYKALMARLRREEEERSYQRMLKQEPGTRMEDFSRQFPSTLSTAQAFAEVNRPAGKADEGDDDVTYADVHRQLMLILNFVVSILGVAATIWAAARWWSTPARLFVTMAGAIIVGVAEVAVYSGYVWRMGDAKSKQEQQKEVREVVNTWVVGKQSEGEGEGKWQQDGSSGEKVVSLREPTTDTDQGVRRRLKGEVT